jgi:hypothetical protein
MPPLEKPALAAVSPGQPVTAQGWNAIVDGLSALYDAVLALGTGTLEVSVLFGGNPVPGVQVVAVPLGEGNPLNALPPHGDVTNYIVTGINPGNWRVLVEAAGFLPETRDVTVPAAEPLVVNLRAGGVTVPDLFGVPAQDALAMLGELQLSVDLILDVTGHEISRSALPPAFQNQPILAQAPEAGTVVDPAAQRMRLLVATALEQTPVVTMPSLVGLTQDEVATVLNRLGLVLGKTTVRSTGD